MQGTLENLLEQLLIFKEYKQDACISSAASVVKCAACLQAMEKAAKAEKNDEAMTSEKYRMAYEFRKELAGFARALVELASRYGFDGNLWQYAVAHYIATNENAFSLASELRKNAEEPHGDAIIMRECGILRRLFFFDFEAAMAAMEAAETAPFAETASFAASCEVSASSDSELLDRVMNFRGSSEGFGKAATQQGRLVGRLRERLAEARDEREFYHEIKNFYANCGVGFFGLNKAFVVRETNGKAELAPIENVSAVSFDDLVGCEIQKEMLISNTEAFLKGSTANNVLLYGDSGTGKSTSIRALLNTYSGEGLKMIQVYRHQMHFLPDIIAKIKGRNYRFIIYMDDLSFEDFETEYKYLKAVIEGGLEPRPENVLIYASSNRRHFIKETHGDRKDEEFDGEIFKSDTLEEKRSLADRFGVQIYFGKPSREGYHEIVAVLAQRENIGLSKDELHAEATKWEIRHGGVSGRSARQFVDYVKGMESLKE